MARWYFCIFSSTIQTLMLQHSAVQTISDDLHISDLVALWSPSPWELLSMLRPMTWEHICYLAVNSSWMHGSLSNLRFPSFKSPGKQPSAALGIFDKRCCRKYIYSESVGRVFFGSVNQSEQERPLWTPQDVLPVVLWSQSLKIVGHCCWRSKVHWFITH